MLFEIGEKYTPIILQTAALLLLYPKVQRAKDGL